MLSRRDNELITLVGEERPMREVLRRYWMPAIRSTQLERDGAPARVRLLGRELRRLPGQRRPRRVHRRGLPAQGHLDGARPQRGLRSHLHLPRVEDRRERRRRRRPERAGRAQAGIRRKGEGRPLSGPRGGRDRVGVPRGRRGAAVPRLRVQRPPRHSRARRRRRRQLQLAAEPRGIPRLEPRQHSPQLDRRAGDRVRVTNGCSRTRRPCSSSR